MHGSGIRLGRLFDRDSGRSFVVAIDHGLTIGPQPGAVKVLDTIDQMVECGPDAILLSPGILAIAGKRFANRQAPATMVRTDFFINQDDPRLSLHDEQYRPLCSPDYAAALGADSIIQFLILQPETGRMFADNVRAVSTAAEQAHRIGLPLIIEVVTWGSQIMVKKDADLLALGCRMAVELGADAVKTEWTGDVQSMRDVIEGCPAPVLVLGGARSASTDALFDATEQALAAGARGVIYGRNVWQADDPTAVASKLAQVIHG